MSQPYCGIGKVPKGRVRGSMKACAEVGQVRHWGEKKIDQRTLIGAKAKDTIKETRGELAKQHSAARGSNKQLGRFIVSLQGRVDRGIASAEDKQKLRESKVEIKKVKRILKLSAAKLMKMAREQEADKKKAAAAKTRAVLKKTPTAALKEIPLKKRKAIINKADKKISGRVGTKKKIAKKK
jgi:hypothetical protein